MDRNNILRVFKIATVIAGLALAAAALKAGEPWELWWWAMALPVIAWMIGPGAAAYFIAAERPSNPRLLAMGVYFTAFVVSGALGYYDGLISPEGSTAGLVVIFLPLYQWGAFLAVLLLLAGVEWLSNRRSQS